MGCGRSVVKAGEGQAMLRDMRGARWSRVGRVAGRGVEAADDVNEYVSFLDVG